jgi:hypothetical protein
MVHHPVLPTVEDLGDMDGNTYTHGEKDQALTRAVGALMIEVRSGLQTTVLSTNFNVSEFVVK